MKEATLKLKDTIATSLMAEKGMRGDEVDEYGRDLRGEFAYEAGERMAGAKSCVDTEIASLSAAGRGDFAAYAHRNAVSEQD